MQRIILFLLAFFARAIIRRHQPYIIGITGTIGKTTLSTNIARLLQHTYGADSTRISPYHYNGEYGLPLTIIGARTGGKNPFLWMLVFIRAIITYIRPYERYLVLEYGIDHPGEMEYLLSIARPHIGVLSPVAPNHLEQFGTFEAYLRAKLFLISSTLEHPIAHESHRSHIDREDIRYYGQSTDSDAYIVSCEQTSSALMVTLSLCSDTYSVSLPVFGLYQGENILPLYLIADLLGIAPTDIADIAPLLIPEEGRSRILKGVAGSEIIDGSYNGGYESIIRGIESLTPFISSHKIYCVLGDMRELGADSDTLHRDLADAIHRAFGGSDHVVFYLVGPQMRDVVAPILSEHYSVTTSLSSRHIGSLITLTLHSDTLPQILYVKGSQNTIFLEEAVACFLADARDRSLLCRQSQAWMGEKNLFFSTLDASIGTKP